MKLLSTVSVGVDPVAVELRNDHEAWVVNHLSDSVSIVDIRGTPHVRETLQVGDEPWDIVFGDHQKNKTQTGNQRNRAFISAAYRGQSHPQFKKEYLYTNRYDSAPMVADELMGRADVWVFDVDESDKKPSLAGIVNLLTDSVRSLAVSEDGRSVFAASFKSGNRTTAIEVGFNDLLTERWSADGVGNPEPRLIIQEKNKRWLDEFGRDWSKKSGAPLADNDLFVINATYPFKLGQLDRPVYNRQAIVKTIQGVGTILFDVETDGNYLYASGMDANNTIAFEERLKEKFVSNIVAKIDLKNDYRMSIIRLDDKNRAGMALPAGMAIMKNKLLLALMGGNSIVGIDTKSASIDSLIGYTGSKTHGDGGPVDIKPDGAGHRLFVYTRFDNKVSVYSLINGGFRLAGSYAMQDGESQSLREGRRYFYDASLTSGNGNVSCASCHIFGGSDKLQWDLSKANTRLELDELEFIPHPDPAIRNLKTSLRAIRLKVNPAGLKVGDTVTLGGQPVPLVFSGSKQQFADQLLAEKIDFGLPSLAYLKAGAPDKRLHKYKLDIAEEAWVLIDTPFFHPIKGPMLTLPLYGIADSGAMHFRGDVQGLAKQNDKPCKRGRSVEERAIQEFNSPCDGSQGTFEALLGGSALDDQKMRSLSAFLLSLAYPPNPVRPLDNSYVSKNGADIFFNQKTMADVLDFEKLYAQGPLVFGCVDCHKLDRKNRNFGTSRKMYSAPVVTLQDAKIPHLRFLYDRIGRFNYGSGDTDVGAAGFNHGGTTPINLFFVKFIWILNEDDIVDRYDGKSPYAELFEFIMGFDTNLYPMYGRQMTVASFRQKNALSDDNETIRQDRQLQKYIYDVYSPENTNESQCTIYYSFVRPDGSFYQTALEKYDVSNIIGAVSVDKINLFIEKTKKTSSSPITFTCL